MVESKLFFQYTYLVNNCWHTPCAEYNKSIDKKIYSAWYFTWSFSINLILSRISEGHTYILFSNDNLAWNTFFINVNGWEGGQTGAEMCTPKMFDFTKWFFWSGWCYI